MSGVEVAAVKDRKDMKDFLDLPWTVYRDDPNWVPPVKSEVSRMLNPRKHPFWEFSERELFLARRGDEPVGRIVALIDGHYNRYQKEKMGAWGFFECRHDPEAAMALFSAAEAWARNKGMAFMRGPLNPSTNYEVGMLIQGFDSPPVLMMTYNPPYYLELVSACRYRKEKDLLAYRFTSDFKPPDWAFELAERIVQKNEIKIECPKKWRKADILALSQIYNDAWAERWGFAPMSIEEAAEIAHSMSPIKDPDLAFFMLYRNEVVGIGVILPDINPFLKRLNGKIGPDILIKKLRYWPEVTGLRGVIFGIKDKYRQLGLPLAAFDHVMKMLHKKPRYKYIELGWNLEDNHAINRLYEDGGGRVSKIFRIYRKDF